MHQLTAVDKCVLLAIGFGANGGLIQAIISQIKNQQKNNFIYRAIKIFCI